ncbi:MAG: dienelactone hydrolase [Candidatus Aegiribacteria sp.]|nr:dienelactone hydrolase [Candidatus Aegiribacteria sp.]
MALVPPAEEPAYDPLIPSFDETPEILDLTVTDERRQRDIPVRVYVPHDGMNCPLVLFSHGLGGSRETCGYLGQHWSSRGYLSVFIQHPGSDTSVWQDLPVDERMDALINAASLQSFLQRVGDVVTVLDRLQQWNGEEGHLLQGRMDMTSVGMSGHSFGAITTQAVSGQRAAGGTIFTDERIDAAVIMSPSSPRMMDPEDAFAQVNIPWMLMTGTEDESFIGNASMEDRLAVYPALPEGDKYQLVLHRAEHSAFTERALPGDTEQRNPNHHRAILALSTAFWDAYLSGNAEAMAWLQGGGPASILEENDSWQFK